MSYKTYYRPSHQYYVTFSLCRGSEHAYQCEVSGNLGRTSQKERYAYFYRYSCINSIIRLPNEGSLQKEQHS